MNGARKNAKMNAIFSENDKFLQKHELPEKGYHNYLQTLFRNLNDYHCGRVKFIPIQYLAGIIKREVCGRIPTPFTMSGCPVMIMDKFIHNQRGFQMKKRTLKTL
ncbi:MAG: hypothetical protein B9J98_08240 [Candidatus Terraquivivens tikiterensis]|uniref:Uncharacterized protein n=1 Tax=Candidatus Terraquivivens tikiterensis TaxID=1980982 RepID=A0A2R7Y0W5_9ARCH|nr:MAG: hypothetical protein B9J98_08240 [Candidatus Terraquivivens tikiterensis]